MYSFFSPFTWPCCIVTNFFVMKRTNASISQIYFIMKLYMFRTVRLFIVSSLFTVHWAVVYVIHTAFKQDQDETAVPSWSCSKAVYKPVWRIPLLSVQWIISWWWTDELSETCRTNCPKHVEFHNKINLWNWCIWLVYSNVNIC